MMQVSQAFQAQARQALQATSRLQASKPVQPALERLEKARHALKEGCWHLTYSKHRNACQAAKALGGIALPHDGKWAVVF